MTKTEKAKLIKKLIKEEMFAVFCEEAGICGAGTKEDMLKLKEDIKGCPARHTIKRCEVRLIKTR